jgi:hypothetical protein
MKFSIRDLLWLTLLVAVLVAWAKDRDRLEVEIRLHSEPVDDLTLPPVTTRIRRGQVPSNLVEFLSALEKDDQIFGERASPDQRPIPALRVDEPNSVHSKTDPTTLP